MSLGTILLIVLILFLIGALPSWPHSRSWGYAPSGLLGVVLVMPIGGAVMPGVSAPPARGVELAVIEPLIAHIRASGKLRLADLAEYNPNLDQDNRSARVAARLVHQLTK